MERYLIIKTRDELLRIKMGRSLYLNFLKPTSASLVPQMIRSFCPKSSAGLPVCFSESGVPGMLILIRVVLSRCRHDNIGERVSCLIRMR